MYNANTFQQFVCKYKIPEKYCNSELDYELQFLLSALFVVFKKVNRVREAVT